MRIDTAALDQRVKRQSQRDLFCMYDVPAEPTGVAPGTLSGAPAITPLARLRLRRTLRSLFQLSRHRRAEHAGLGIYTGHLSKVSVGRTAVQGAGEVDVVVEFGLRVAGQFQSPTLAFLIGGVLLAASGSKLVIPDAIYKFAVFMLLMRIGLNGGMEIREANLADMILPMLAAFALGGGIVLLGLFTLARLPGIKRDDAIATAGLFGAVSASTLGAAMVLLEQDGIAYEAWVPALYPFMDIPALVLAIVLARMYAEREGTSKGKRTPAWTVVKDSLQGSALSALILGLLLGLFTRPDQVFETFYDPLFRGLLSVLMLIMGMEAWQRLAELRRVAQWYAVYAAIMPIIHGLIAFGLGYLIHLMTGFSPGGVILLAVLAASSSDISGPPTLRAGIPSANPASYIGSSTSVGTPIAIGVGIPFFIALAEMVF